MVWVGVSLAVYIELVIWGEMRKGKRRHCPKVLLKEKHLLLSFEVHPHKIKGKSFQRYGPHLETVTTFRPSASDLQSLGSC
jgi:hypothetical protein